MTDRPGAARRVHLARTGDAALDSSRVGFEGLAARSSVGHVLVDAPGEADLVLLTQPHLCPDPLSLRALRESEAWAEHRAKTFAIDFRDRPWCAFPGLYTSMPSRHLRSRWQRAWVYPWIDEARFTPMRDVEPDLLFSFIGGRSHPCRDRILEMETPLGVIEDSTGFDYMDQSPSAAPTREHFAEVLARSRFVLCPRGHGTSSFRMQEVLAAGRVPVVISDDWVAPEGPDWASVSVRWPEGSVDGLASELQRLDDDFPRMSAAAADLYDTWFSSESMFDRMIEQLVDLGDVGAFPGRGVRDLWWARLTAGGLRARSRRGRR